MILSLFLFKEKMKKVQKKVQQGLPEKKINILLIQYAEARKHPSNQLIHWICVPLMLFSVIGLAWSVPFPHLAFLGKYNGFLNWASFLIAFTGYYYYRLSPVLSYMMILLFFAIALVVVQVEKWSIAGGPALWLVCVITLLLSLAGQFIGQKIEGKNSSFLTHTRFILIGPAWLFNSFSAKIGVKY